MMVISWGDNLEAHIDQALTYALVAIASGPLRCWRARVGIEVFGAGYRGRST